MRSPGWYSSVGTRSRLGMTPSILPRSTMTSLRSNRRTVPDRMSPPRPLNSSNTMFFSTCRMRCSIACLAVWAAMRPKFCGVTSISMLSPSWMFGARRRASVNEISSCLLTTFSTTNCLARARMLPVLRSISMRRSLAGPTLLLEACSNADSTAWNRTSLSMPFSRWKYSTATINSPFISLFYPRAAHPNRGTKKWVLRPTCSVSPINQPKQLYAISDVGQAHMFTSVTGLFCGGTGLQCAANEPAQPPHRRADWPDGVFRHGAALAASRSGALSLPVWKDDGPGDLHRGKSDGLVGRLVRPPASTGDDIRRIDGSVGGQDSDNRRVHLFHRAAELRGGRGAAGAGVDGACHRRARFSGDG